MQVTPPTRKNENIEGYGVYNRDKQTIVEQLTGGTADQCVFCYEEAEELKEQLSGDDPNNGDHLEIVAITPTTPPEAFEDRDIVKRHLDECDIGDYVKLPIDHHVDEYADSWVKLTDFTIPNDYGPRIWVYTDPVTGDYGGMITLTKDHNPGPFLTCQRTFE